uniref:Uncharacterized protein n=1 Tax=Rangifer tarandus platyrhynchus TaxID=3082113 RepID=A0ACB0EW22_RANTA|nr:unnamed protein product [Rangifer tarandus platyrhynchus]
MTSSLCRFQLEIHPKRRSRDPSSQGAPSPAQGGAASISEGARLWRGRGGLGSWLRAEGTPRVGYSSPAGPRDGAAVPGGQCPVGQVVAAAPARTCGCRLGAPRVRQSSARAPEGAVAPRGRVESVRPGALAARSPRETRRAGAREVGSARAPPLPVALRAAFGAEGNGAH